MGNMPSQASDKVRQGHGRREAVAVGMDLGASASRLAICIDGTVEVVGVLPSVVHIPSSETWKAGMSHLNVPSAELITGSASELLLSNLLMSPTYRRVPRFRLFTG